jgi:nicotinamide/nicotinate riboside kinase
VTFQIFFFSMSVVSSHEDALLVGLGGVTNGGKTTMCRSLERRFSSSTEKGLRVLSMHLDHYFRSPDDPHHVHLDDFNHHDWDSLAALDIDRFLSDLQINRQKCDLLLVEGFLIFSIDYKERGFDLMYYFDLPYEECLRRRLTRNYDPPDPPNYFVGHVWNASVRAKEDAVRRFNPSSMCVVDTTEQSFEQIERRIVEDIQRALLSRQKTDDTAKWKSPHYLHLSSRLAIASRELSDCAINKMTNYSVDAKQTSMMMLQPTSGRKGFDSVKDESKKSSSSRSTEANPSVKSNEVPGYAQQQAIIRQTTDAIKRVNQWGCFLFSSSFDE